MSRRILIVDDHPGTAESIALLLRSDGNEVQTASDGLEGIALAEKFLPDFVLLDIRMPHLDGCEAARRIRQQPWGRDMVLIAFTAGSQREAHRLCREAGFNAHLIKPASPAEISRLFGSMATNGQHLASFRSRV
jgi:CheY-like chemotaxis protein